jgi:hypothetical protein
LLTLLASTLLYAVICHWLYGPILGSKNWNARISAITGQLWEMAAYADLPSQMLRSWGRSIKTSFGLLPLMIRPTLWLLLPSLLAVGYWHQGWSNRPMLPDEEVVLSVKSAGSARPALLLPGEVECLTEAVLNPADQRHYWVLRARKPGQFLIQLSQPQAKIWLVCSQTPSIGQQAVPVSPAQLIKDLLDPSGIRLYRPASQLSFANRNWSWWWQPILLTLGWLTILQFVALPKRSLRTG